MHKMMVYNISYDDTKIYTHTGDRNVPFTLLTMTIHVFRLGLQQHWWLISQKHYENPSLSWHHQRRLSRRVTAFNLQVAVRISPRAIASELLRA